MRADRGHTLRIESANRFGLPQGSHRAARPTLHEISFLGAAATPLPPWTSQQRRKLGAFATRLRLPARTTVYEAGSQAHSVFFIADGAVKSFRDLPSGRRRIITFLYPSDIFGLAERGRYLNSTQTILPSTLYRLPVDALTKVLLDDGELQFRFLCKITHKLREAQRKTLIVGRRDAAGRLAMFILMMKQYVAHSARTPQEVPLPMSRADIADFVNLSPEALSRASARLVALGLVRFEHRNLARILDERGLTRLAATL